MLRMQTLSHSILGLFRRPDVYAAPSPVHRLSHHSQALLAFMTSAPPVLPRRVFPLVATPNPPAHRLSRSLHTYLSMPPCSVRVKGKKLDKPNRRPANNIMISLGEGTTKEFIAPYGDGRPTLGKQNARNTYGDEGACLGVIHGQHDTAEKILDVSDYETGSDVEEGWAAQTASDPVDSVYPLDRFPRSSHRNGSIYRGTERWEKTFHVADRGETRLEPMKLSNPARCILNTDGRCVLHQPCPMFHIFSMKLAKLHVDGGLVELYGYIAARDGIDRLLNHFINFSRDDPIMVEQGSFINMVGPKRGIELLDTNIIEYDMRIKVGKEEKDDLQLIDGVSIIDDIDTEDRRVFKGRIHGKYGAIDITAARIDWAIESTIEVLISDVYSNFSLCVSCFTSGLQEETQLFDGVIGESCGLKRSVVAVRIDTNLDLKFKVGSGSSICAEHLCFFKASEHGYVTQEIETALALISVKVTWSPLPRVRTY